MQKEMNARSVGAPPNAPRLRPTAWACAMLVGLLLSGCGQKGPLKLPPPSGSAIAASSR
ncbi:MAG: LPS translocon maturation chaperone LptM [Burkholderiales bacterium]